MTEAIASVLAREPDEFLVMFPPLETTAPDLLQINVVLNWFQDLKQRAPARYR